MTFQKKFGKRPATIKSNSQDRESDARGQKEVYQSIKNHFVLLEDSKKEKEGKLLLCSSVS